MKLGKFFNENFFTLVYAAVSTFMVLHFVKTPEGQANFIETVALGCMREAIFLITVFVLIKMLAGFDTNLKDDLFKDSYTTTAFIIALVAGSAWMLH